MSPHRCSLLGYFCDKNYNQLLPILAEKMHQEKVQQEKLKAVKARLNFEETSQYFESGAPSRRRDVGKELDLPNSRQPKGAEHVQKPRTKTKSILSKGRKEVRSLRDSAGGHWKSKSKKQMLSMEDEDLSQPWVCEETNPFTPRIRYFDLPKRIRMPSHVKTYDESEDPEERER
ncbi:hypothetical protein Tco_1332576 [Tanacetum coccineum]